MREAVGKAGWNPGLAGKPQTIEDLKFDNYFKEIFLDSDTKVALISSAPSDVPYDWFLTNEMMAQARATRERAARRAAAVHPCDLHARAAGLDGGDRPRPRWTSSPIR